VKSRLAAGMGYRHWVVLRSLAQTSSETRSAHALGISQSAVHQTLVQLEHMTGGSLFVRAHRGLRLTETGERVLQACRLAWAELQQAQDEWALEQGVVQGRLLIGTLPFSTGHLLSEAVDRVLKAHPGLGVTIVDGTYDALVGQLQQAEIDFIVGALRPVLPDPALQQETLFLDQLVVVARAVHPLARRPHLNWSDLQQAAWILPMPHTPAQAAFEQALQVAGIPVPADALRVNSALMMQALLAQSDRLALMSPRQVQREMAAGLLVQLPVTVRHQPRMIGIVRRANFWPTPAAQTLLDALRAVAREIAEQS
jgi:LysR family transcriptional regulator of gallate degradation